MPQSPHRLRNDLKCVEWDVKPCTTTTNRRSTVDQWGISNLIPICTFLSPTLYLLPFFRYSMQNSSDLDLTVILGQSSWCQSIFHGLFSLWLSLTPSWYLSPFLKYLACNFTDFELDSSRSSRVKVYSAIRNEKPIGCLMVSCLTSFESRDVTKIVII